MCMDKAHTFDRQISGLNNCMEVTSGKTGEEVNIISMCASFCLPAHYFY